MTHENNVSNNWYESLQHGTLFQTLILKIQPKKKLTTGTMKMICSIRDKQ